MQRRSVGRGGGAALQNPLCSLIKQISRRSALCGKYETLPAEGVDMMDGPVRENARFQSRFMTRMREGPTVSRSEG